MATLPETTPTTNAGDGDRGTNASVRTFVQTQATSFADPRLLTNPTGGINSVTGQPLNIAPQFSDPRLLTNPTGGINSFTGETLNTAPPTSAGVGQYDDATGGAGTNVNQTAGDDVGSSYGGASQAENDALNQALKTQTGSISTDGSNQVITPQANVLDRFSSYTYRASWYLMTPAQYKQLVYSKKKTINGYMLLVQSGGAPQNSGGFKGALGTQQGQAYPDGSVEPNKIPGAKDADAGRNPAFPLDFYIDSVTIENFLTGGGTRAPHSTKNIKFTIVENNGITLLDRLYEAVQDFMPASGQKNGINYASVVYLMVIRFYGYDEQGNLVTNISGNKSDPNSVIEKFIPFKISKCDWTIDSKLVTYSFEGLAPGEGSAAGTRRGTIPYNIELTAANIGDLLGQDVKYSATPAATATPGASTTSSTPDQSDAETRRLLAANAAAAPPKADSSASSKKNSITQGLMGAMNQFQQDLVKQGVYEKADEYEIVFANPGPGGGGTAIKNARLIPPGKKTNASQTPMATVPTTDPSSAVMEKISKDIKSRNYSITAGMQLVQAIELAIRNSTFVTDQNVLFFNEDDALQVKNDANKKDIVWFNITFQAIQLEYDNKRNDYAQKITFIINTYTPMNFSSNYYPINKFRGLHKQYNYWFTGKNTAVIDYKETMNNLYNLTISGDQTKGNLAFQQRKAFTSSMRDQPFYNFQTASAENSAGDNGKQNEPQANLAESLYDPVGLANCNVRIVGDPAWIQQGSFAGGVSAKEFDFNAFLPDGTINFDAREVMFEIAWQRPQDYDINTGLADPYAKSSSRQPVQSRVYTAMQCTSEFRQGSFYQNLEGKLYFFMKPNASNKAATAPPPATQADVRRIDNATTSDNPSAANASAAAAGASGRPTALAVPALSAGPGSGTPNVINSAPPGPKDTVLPASPPAPATAGTGGQVLAAPATVQSTLPIIRTPRQRFQIDGLANDPVTPQDMARDF
jgi:hypothetical protein